MNAVQVLLSAPVEQLLVSGGDARSAVDEQTGLNSFGCSPGPGPQVFSFGSSTASSISTGAFCLVRQERDSLLELSGHRDLMEEQTEQLRSALKSLLALERSAVEIVFSPSGTDSTLHALFLTRILSGMAPLDCIVAGSDETGSGVPHAITGRHFSAITAAGVAVIQGAPVGCLAANVTLISLPLADACGSPRDPAALDRELFDVVSGSVSAGRRVLLQVLDCSKLGRRSPSPDCLRLIRSEFPDSVQIVVDACQMRISAARLKWHLAQGHMVLISGSKFFTGPPFSGALLAPPAVSARLEAARQVPDGLQDYSDRSAWPRVWRSIRSAMPDRMNMGQYFRWVAAIEEMRAYFTVPMSFRCAVLHRFAKMASELIRCHGPDLLLVEEPPSSLTEIQAAEDAEMTARTILPFLLRQDDGWISPEQAKQVYCDLNQDLSTRLPAALTLRERAIASQRCHIGQPVGIGCGDGSRTAALRICSSARIVSQLWSGYRADPSALSLARENHEIGVILDKIALLLRYRTH